MLRSGYPLARSSRKGPFCPRATLVHKAIPTALRVGEQRGSLREFLNLIGRGEA